MRVLLRRELEQPSQSEISQFNSQIFPLNQDVLRLEIPMNHSIGVAVLKREQKLIDDTAHCLLSKRHPIHISLEIAVHELKDKLQLVLPGNDLSETDHVGMVEGFE